MADPNFSYDTKTSDAFFNFNKSISFSDDLKTKYGNMLSIFDKNDDGIIDSKELKDLWNKVVYNAGFDQKLSVKEADAVVMDAASGFDYVKSFFKTKATTSKELFEFLNVLKNTVVSNTKEEPVDPNFNPSDYPQYDNVVHYIKECAKDHKNNLNDDEIKNIAKMVLLKCAEYNISDISPVVVQILGKESGYVFNDEVMKNPNKSFKGVMQVGLEACCSLYGESCAPFRDYDGKIRKSTSKTENYKYEYDHRCKQDHTRIAKLKEKYPTPKDLYLAMQNDPELGLEVGILTFKLKLHYAKGNIDSAVEKYCHGQYKCDTVRGPKTIDIAART